MQSITLNGKPFPGMKLCTHIMKGGTLVFEMGAAARR